MSKKERDKLWNFEFAAMHVEMKALKHAVASGKDSKFELLQAIEKMHKALTVLGYYCDAMSTDLDKLETQLAKQRGR